MLPRNTTAGTFGIDIRTPKRVHMISIAGGCTIDFVLEVCTFELQGLMRSLQFGE
jgi:hypothetical protein